MRGAPECVLYLVWKSAEAACVQGNCVNGRGLFVYENGDRYDGDWIGALRQGFGRFETADSIYQGNWHAHQRHGHGSFTHPDGSSYIGSWETNQRTGRGIFTWKDGSKYDGEYQGNRRHGRGTMDYSNGDRYEGEWDQDRQHGRGKYVYSFGKVWHDGQWEEDSPIIVAGPPAGGCPVWHRRTESK